MIFLSPIAKTFKIKIPRLPSLPLLTMIIWLIPYILLLIQVCLMGR